MVIVPNDYLVHRLLECSWAHLRFALQIVAKLICFCLRLLVQLSSSMLWMKKYSTIFSLKKVDFICDKGVFKSWFMSCICSGGIYHIKVKKLSINTWVHFLATSTYTFVFFHKLLVYKGFNITMSHIRHVGSQRRVHPLGTSASWLIWAYSSSPLKGDNILRDPFTSRYACFKSTNKIKPTRRWRNTRKSRQRQHWGEFSPPSPTRLIQDM